MKSPSFIFNSRFREIMASSSTVPDHGSYSLSHSNGASSRFPCSAWPALLSESVPSNVPGPGEWPSTRHSSSCVSLPVALLCAVLPPESRTKNSEQGLDTLFQTSYTEGLSRNHRYLPPSQVTSPAHCVAENRTCFVYL